MLLFILLVTAVAFTNVIADIEDDIEECGRSIDFDQLEETMELPGYNEIEKLCPVAIGYMDCVENTIKRYTGYTMRQLKRHIDDAEVSAYITTFINIRNLAEDLCSEDSQLNKDYRAHSECFKQQSAATHAVCRNAAEAAVQSEEALNEMQSNIGDVISYSDLRECMTEAYDTVCLGIEILENCGEDAFNTYRQIMKRSTLFKYSFCTEETLEHAKQKFLNELEEEESQKDLYHLAFDIKKRRK